MIKRKQFKDLLYVKQGKEYLQCSKCGEIKELTEENYYKKDGGKNWILICKDCKKKRYEDKKAEIKVYSKKYICIVKLSLFSYFIFIVLFFILLICLLSNIDYQFNFIIIFGYVLI